MTRLVLLCLLSLSASSWVFGAPATTPQDQVFQLEVHSTINPGAAGLLNHAIKRAEREGGKALIVRINTPGGLLSTTREMVTAISESRVPIIGYVAPAGASATSAGAFILLSTHLAVMNTGTNVGASSPVSGDGKEIDPTLKKKILEDTAAFMRSIARERRRNEKVAELFVTEAKSLAADEALKAGVIDRVVSDSSELLTKLDDTTLLFHGQQLRLELKGATIVEVEPRFIDRLLSEIGHPQIAYLLMSLGSTGVFIELLSPGLIFPGVAGAIAVILGLVSLQALPVSTGFLLLMVLGVVLMVSEYFVAGFGVLGIGGAIAFILGSLNLFDDPSMLEHQEVIRSISIAVASAMVLISIVVTRLLKSSGRAGKQKLEGAIGEAMACFDREGHVLIGEERWEADTTEILNREDKIEVIRKQANGRLLVRKARP